MITADKFQLALLLCARRLLSRLFPDHLPMPASHDAPVLVHSSSSSSLRSIHPERPATPLSTVSTQSLPQRPRLETAVSGLKHFDIRLSAKYVPVGVIDGVALTRPPISQKVQDTRVPQ